MKKALILILSMIIVLCTGCVSLDEETEYAIKEDVYNIYESIRPVWKDAKGSKKMMKPLIDWAQENEVAYSVLPAGNLMLSLDATDKYQKAPSTILQCDISKDDPANKAQCAAMILAAVKNIQEHGNVKILFTLSDKKEFDGAHALTEKQLKADNLISLDHCDKTKLYTGSAASKEYKMVQKINNVPTNGNVAYKITISGLEGGDSSDRTRKHGNPIKALGGFMNSCQSSGMAYQISSFKGGESAGTYPSYAQIIVTVDKNDEERIKSKYKTMENKFENSNRNNENDMKIELSRCKVPRQSYSERNTANIMSFLYTIDDGIFTTGASEDDDEQMQEQNQNQEQDLDQDQEQEQEYDDDEGPAAISNIGYVKSEGKDRLAIGVKGRAIYPNIFKTMTRAYKKTSDLSDFSMREVSSYPYWPYTETSELMEGYQIAAQQVDLSFEPVWTFAENECAIFYEKRPDMDMICLGVNIQSGSETAKSLVMYLQSLNGEQ